MNLKMASYGALSLAMFIAGCGSGNNESSGRRNAGKASSQNGNSLQQPNTPRFPDKLETRYRFLLMKSDSARKVFREFTEVQKEVVYALNRTDSVNAGHIDTLIVPEKFVTSIFAYSPFPYSVPALRKINKMIIFSYPREVFGAYRNGYLVRWGPTNMGRKSNPTPTGLFYTNWKAEETTSTFNDEWKLKWNFNIVNDSGVGFHEYSMPGYPASHACLRLERKDAQFLYHWADQWIEQNKQTLAAKGTPVLVYGTYPFGQRRPWREVLNNPHAMDISVKELTDLISPQTADILNQQKRREAVSPFNGRNDVTKI